MKSIEVLHLFSVLSEYGRLHLMTTLQSYTKSLWLCFVSFVNRATVVSAVVCLFDNIVIFLLSYF